MKNRFFNTVIFLLFVAFFSNLLLAEQNTNQETPLRGEDIYKKRCFGCHGPDGNVKAFGISRKLNELSREEIAERLQAFTDKRLQGVGGATGTMHKQVTSVSKQEYDAILGYVLSTIAVNTPK